MLLLLACSLDVKLFMKKLDTGRNKQKEEHYKQVHVKQLIADDKDKSLLTQLHKPGLLKEIFFFAVYKLPGFNTITDENFPYVYLG